LRLPPFVVITATSENTAETAAAAHRLRAANNAVATNLLLLTFPYNCVKLKVVGVKGLRPRPLWNYRFRLLLRFRGGFSFRMDTIKAIVAIIAVHALKKTSNQSFSSVALTKQIVH
jgi:hypothetical protein